MDIRNTNNAGQEDDENAKIPTSDIENVNLRKDQ